LTAEQAEALKETSEQFTAVFNLICAKGWALREGNAYTLHRLTYREGKTAFPALVSDHHVQARQRASEVLKSAITREKQGKKSRCPSSISCPPRYNLHTYRLDWQNAVVKLSTTRGRMHVPFTVPSYATYAIGNPVTTADLMERSGRWFLHITVSLPQPATSDNGSAVGVDLGITHPAVTSDARFLGKKHWREVIKRHVRLKRKLQSNGSKSAKRHLRRLAGRDARFRRDCDHVLSKRILEGVEPGTVIVVENLTHIRTRVKARRGEAKRRLHSWSFAQLKAFLEYKAEAKGCRMEAVDPRHTSQRCNRCGHTHRGNRRSQSDFRCRECHHQVNADLNAARNIRDKYLVGWGSAPSGAPQSTGVSSQLG
jgi:putative transposase